MSDPFEDRVRRGLRREADGLAVPSPDPRSVERDADRPAGSVWFGVAAGVVVLAVAGALVFTSRQPSVVLEQPRGGEASSVTPVPATVEALTGRVFESVGGLPGAPDPDGTLTLQFREAAPPDQPDPGIGIRTDPGCNRAGGTYELRDDGTFILKDYESTLMGCADVGSVMDDWARALLGQIPPRLELASNRLLVVAEDVTIQLVDIQLQDCEAVIQDIVTQVMDAVSAVDVAAFLQGELILADENRVEGGAQLARLEQSGCAHDAVRARIGNELAVRTESWLRDDNEDNRTRYFIAGYLSSILSPGTSGQPRPSMAPGPLTPPGTFVPTPTLTPTPGPLPPPATPPPTDAIPSPLVTLPPLATATPPTPAAVTATPTAPMPLAPPTPNGGDPGLRC